MIGLIFYHGTEIIYVQIDGHNIGFSNSQFGAKIAPIEGLRLSQAGVIKEHPDLKDNPSWREEAIKRFKETINILKDEESIAEYIIMDLKKYSYIPKWKQKAGFRRVAIS